MTVIIIFYTYTTRTTFLIDSGTRRARSRRVVRTSIGYRRSLWRTKQQQAIHAQIEECSKQLYQLLFYTSAGTCLSYIKHVSKERGKKLWLQHYVIP